MSRRSKAIAAGAVGVLALAGAAALSTAAVTVHVARKVIVPPSRREEDVLVRTVDLDRGLIVFETSPDARLPGEYSFWFDLERGHARIGEIVAQDATTVTRRILGVDFGDLAAARRGRIAGWLYLHPRELGVPSEDVEIETPVGPAPAWHIPAEAPSTRWAIHVHGRAVRRPEALRAIPVFRDAGYTSLVVSYRNDGEAPRSLDHRYALGDREWMDVEAAMRYAVEHGAEELVLVGWSMGGATVLQALTRSELGERVTGVVLESPVVDWVTALDFQIRAHRLPVLVRAGVVALFRSRWARLLTGLAEPLDLDRLDFVARARELDRPILLLHSADDGFVPATASRLLAEARRDIVTYEEFEVARHAKLWNYDRARWERAVREWLRKLTSEGQRRTSQRA